WPSFSPCIGRVSMLSHRGSAVCQRPRSNLVLRCESSRPGDWSFQSAQWRAARAIADRREHWCQPGRDAKAEAATLPFARHLAFARWPCPPRVPSHSTHRKPNSVRASKLITATTACQVKFHREQLRRTRAGHSCENWTVVIAASYHGKSTAV